MYLLHFKFEEILNKRIKKFVSQKRIFPLTSTKFFFFIVTQISEYVH